MKNCTFSLPAATLSAAVDFSGAAVESRNALPILTHLLFRVQHKRLSIVGTDMEIEMEYRIDMNSVTLEKDTDAESILFTLPAKKLKDLLKTAPSDSTVTLSKASESQYTMTFSGLRSRFTLQSLPADSFPSIDSTTAGAAMITMEASEFLRRLSTVTHAMASQDVRYYLNGLHLAGENGEMTMTATDGHRLAQNRVAFNGKDDVRFDAILPRNAVIALPSMLKGASGDLSVAVTQNHILAKVTSGDVERVMKSKQIDGRYPDWKRVIPRSSEQQVSLPRMGLISALKRAAILSNEKYRGVTLTFENNVLTVESRNPENEEAREEMSITNNTHALTIGVNVDYLLTALQNHTEDDVLLQLGSSVTSMLLTPVVENGMLDVIMPMRI